ncbi:hypothetical protein CBR_g31467 [Chara braunii]|uniref:Uncharacterized protein n=1 Tax=Chara braunii TaxID=69332 RepID=A0A388LF42_CHABU|nr:hypothetical protein CBR_g31467 [Chara braunii]|eukprot:GBG80911.1 hypothetical protein CBR_g31467 [Chara braunii]
MAAVEPAVVMEDVRTWRLASTARGSRSHGEAFGRQAGVGRLGATTRPRGRPRMRRCPFAIVASLPPIIRSFHSPRLRRSERLASIAGRDRTHDGEDRGGQRTPSDAGMRPRSPSELRTHAFDVGGLGGGLGDFNVEGRQRASPSEVRTDEDIVRGRVETEEERHARLDQEEEKRLRSLQRWEGRSPYLEEQCRQRDLETGGGGGCDADDSSVPEEAVQGEFVDEGQDAAAGGGKGRGDGETAGDEGQGAAVCGRGEGGPRGDGDVAGVGGDDGPDGDDDDDHGPEDNTGVRGRESGAGEVGSGVRGRESGAGEVGSDVRGRESGAGEVGYDRRSKGGRDSAGSMPPPPAQPPEAGVDAEDQTAAPGVSHSCGSPPTVRDGVGGGWSAVRRVGDRLREDYNAGKGVFAGRTAVQTQAAEGGSGRSSLQMAGLMLGLSRAATRISLVLEAAGTSTDMLQGQQYTSGGEGLLMRPGTRRQRGLSEVEAQLTAEVAAGQAALDAI